MLQFLSSRRCLKPTRPGLECIPVAEVNTAECKTCDCAVTKLTCTPLVSVVCPVSCGTGRRLEAADWDRDFLDGGRVVMPSGERRLADDLTYKVLYQTFAEGESCPGSTPDVDAMNTGSNGMSRRALALTVTFHVRRDKHLLPHYQFWLLTFRLVTF